MCRVPVASRKSRQIRSGGGVLVPGQLEREQPVEVPGDDGERGVQVDVERDAGGQRVEVESADVGVQLVFRHHPLGVAGEQVPVSGGEVVGDEQGWLVAADALHRDLPDLAVDFLELEHVFVQAGPPVAAGAGDGEGLPRRGGQRGQSLKLGLAALAQGEPADAAAGELVKDLVAGQLGVEDQQPGVAAGGQLPVVGEGDDLGCLLGLGDVGVGVDQVPVVAPGEPLGLALAAAVHPQLGLRLMLDALAHAAGIGGGFRGVGFSLSYPLASGFWAGALWGYMCGLLPRCVPAKPTRGLAIY